MADAVLTFNAGSSSIKFSLFDSKARRASSSSPRARSRRSKAPHRISSPRDANGAPLTERSWTGATTFPDLLGAVVQWAEDHLGSDELIAAGHRIVQPPRSYRPERVTRELLTELDKLTPLAPLHEPHNLAPIRAILAARPELPQVACFDTAFHHSMPRVATRFALPREYEAAECAPLRLSRPLL